jgi:hypothetical protein
MARQEVTWPAGNLNILKDAEFFADDRTDSVCSLSATHLAGDCGARSGPLHSPVDFAGVLVGVTVRLMSDGELGRLKVLRGFGSAATD